MVELASTICRKLQRGTGKPGYRPKQAQRKAKNRRTLPVKPLKKTAVTIGWVNAKPKHQLEYPRGRPS
jgi:IS30 family transposase